MLIPALLVFAAGLAYFAYLGLFTRFWQDDWCYNADFQRLGLWGTLKGYVDTTTYASNRFSLTLFSGLLYPLGVPGVQLLPGLTLFLWLAAAFWLIRNVAKVIHYPLPAGFAWLASLALIYFTVYLAPNRFQSFYWRSGILPYTAPTLFGVFLAAIFTRQLLVEKPSAWLSGLAVALAFFGAGFSEAGGATITAGLSAALLYTGLARRRSKSGAGRLFGAVLAAWISAVLALVIMILSPANWLRLQTSPRDGFTSLPQTALLSFRFGFDFIWLSLRGLPLPHGVLTFLYGLIGFLAQPRLSAAVSPSGRAALKWAGIAALAVVVLTAASHAPSAYLEGAPPAERAGIIARFILLAGLAFAAWLAGAWLSGRLPAPGWRLLAAAALLLPTLYTVRSIQLSYVQLQPRFEKIAAVWDERELKIKIERAAGQDVIEVRAIDSQYLGGVLEWYPEPNYVNRCAAITYGVKEIRATLPW